MTLEERYERLYGGILNVYRIFQAFFGEENTDLQGLPSVEDIQAAIGQDGDSNSLSDEQLRSLVTSLSWEYFILVYWKNVRVTNEHNKSIDIRDLYAKIKVTANGTIPFESTGFYLNRATYTKEEFLSDYMHSHINGIPRHNFKDFLPPCLGRGPIRNTIGSLKSECSDEMWMLFCQELAMYVTVESLTGVPWRRLENVGINRTWRYDFQYNPGFSVDLNSACNDAISKEDVKNFILYYLRNGHLAFNYINGHYIPAMTPYQYIMDLSNCFIAFFNSKKNRKNGDFGTLIRKRLLKEYYADGTFLYCTNNTNQATAFDRVIGKEVCVFKGNTIRIAIRETVNESFLAPVLLLGETFAQVIINRILLVINYNYRNERDERRERESAATADKRRIIV